MRFDDLLRKPKIYRNHCSYPQSATKLVPLKEFRQRLEKPLVANSWIEKSTQQVKTINFDVIEDDSLGAFSFCDGETNIIVFHSGTFDILLTTFCTLMGRTTLLPMIAGSKSTSDVTPKWVQEMFGLISDERVMFATLLYRLSIDFLYFHELHHIVSGQTKFVQGQNAHIALADSPQGDSELFPDRKCMEYVADLFAGASLGDCCKTRRFVTVDHDLLPTIEEQEITLPYLTCVAVIILFAFLNCLGHNSTQNYPSLFARLTTVIDMLTRKLSSSDKWRDNVDVIVTAGIRDVQDALRDNPHILGETATDLVLQLDAQRNVDEVFAEMSALGERSMPLFSKWQPYALDIPQSS